MVATQGAGINEITPGRYRHYKGNEYTVVGTARHGETLEEHVVYRQEYGEHGLWVRPKQMFSETVEVDGKDVPRFLPLGSSGEQIGESVKDIFDVQAADVRIERTVSHGHASPEAFWYDQDQHEWVVVLKGVARLGFEDGMVEMKPGDFVNTWAHRKHRAEWTTPDEPTIWPAVHYGEVTATREDSTAS